MKNFFVLLLVIFFSSVLVSQDLPHYMTPAEQRIWNEYRPPFYSSLFAPPPVPVRVMAEWEEFDGIAITWTSFTSILRQIVDYAQDEGLVYIICSDSNTVKNYLASGGVPLINLKFIIAPYNSIWIRDYGPWSVYSNTADSMMFIDWIYNRPRPLDDVIPGYIANFMNVPLYQTNTYPDDFIATGGNFMTDGHGTGFSSKLILNENQGKTEAQIDTIMRKYMGLNRYIKMNTLPYDGIHHIDMHMKLLDEETLLVGKYPPGVADGPQIEANLQYILNNYLNCYSRPYKVVRIPMPPDAGGNYPNTGGDYRTYTNSLIVNKTVIIPTYEYQYDTTAFRIYREAMPGYRVVGINSNAIIPSLGTIHCITKELGSKEPVFISHARITEAVPQGEPAQVKAFIKTRTGMADAYLYYTSDTTSGFSALPMIQSSPDTFTASIPTYTSGTKVYYYISASSVSGRTNSKPITAPQGLYQFYFTDPVPVELISFTAEPLGEGILLKWYAASEINNKGFSLERRSEKTEYKEIAFIPGKGTTTETSFYSYLDAGPDPGAYFYRLIQIDYNGVRNVYASLSVDNLVKRFWVAQNYQNPFNPSTRIKYTLPFNGGNSYKVSLKIYDLLGNEVIVVAESEQPAGDYEALADLSNMAGGVYIYRLSADGYNYANKMILLK